MGADPDGMGSEMGRDGAVDGGVGPRYLHGERIPLFAKVLRPVECHGTHGSRKSGRTDIRQNDPGFVPSLEASGPQAVPTAPDERGPVLASPIVALIAVGLAPRSG